MTSRASSGRLPRRRSHAEQRPTDRLGARGGAEPDGVHAGFHIVLASFGVAFPAMMLIANYIGLRRDDEAALRLARRWSKVAAVTFAVGAVTGTVLSFEFGLLWPAFTGQFGEVFGILFGIEGIFFFLEAIFIAIYIFGWKRLSGWAHFWTGVPIAITGIGGAFSVVAVNSWMNQPQGYTLSGGDVTDVDPLKVIFNPAVPYEVAAHAPRRLHGHRLPGRVRVRRGHAPRAARPPPPARPADPAHGRRASRRRSNWGWATRPLARSPRTSRSSSPGMECVQQTHTHVTEYIYGRCTSDGIKGGIGIPGFDSWLVGFSTDTKVTGLDTVPPDDRPPANTMLHWAFDTMVGIGTALMGLALWLAFAWFRRRDIPRSHWFLRAVAVSGIGAIVAMECGWIVTEVGRQPWVVYNVMRTKDASTGASGVWVTFSIALVLYTVLGIATW